MFTDTSKIPVSEAGGFRDDFYGPHGREWVVVSETLVVAGMSALVAVKVKEGEEDSGGHVL